MSTHPRRAHLHVPGGIGARLADAIAAGMGSWPFIIGQSFLVGAWIVLNLIGMVNHWDPYPFILLNLLFSTQAAYAAPVIMMSQNRQAARDRGRDDTEAAEIDELYAINKTQLRILEAIQTLHTELNAHIRGTTPARGKP
jgi:uncharacterized membrane protein